MKWNRTQLEQLRNLYKNYSAPVCANIMDLTTSQVKGEVRRYGIKSGRTGQFKKGHRPFNKGKKGMNGQSATTFKPGQLPHNTKYDGCITTRRDSKTGISYQYISVEKGRWELLHRYIYEQNFGPVPKGMIVVFKDGNQRNCKIANLAAITRKENARRNYNPAKSHASLKKLYQREKVRKLYGLPPLSKLSKRLVNF